MKESSFHKWGFFIYRCAYGDDDLWERYLAALKQDVDEDLKYNGCDRLLAQYAQWTVVEDLELNAASKDEVREHFKRRNEHHSEVPSRDVSPPTDASSRLPRFTYCLYVDQKCLDTLKEHAEAKSKRKQPGLGPRPPSLVAVVIDADFQRGSGAGSRPAIEGSTEDYLGWGYYNMRYIATLYNSLHYESFRGSEYCRPPAIGPSGRQIMQD
jgi:hypothetical protein